MKYVFGPVNSRRLGISLGIDIVPYKTCSFNCVYCECGCTTELTDEVKEYFPFGEIVSEIRQVLDKGPVIDVVTFSGSGEPTLHCKLGDIIDFIKENYPRYKIAVLTNSSLLHRDDVRRGILKADIIYPSLDAVSEDLFSRIMRPVSGTDPEVIINSIMTLRREFEGLLCLEVFIIPGMNDADNELRKLKDACLKINPDEIHINSLDRPGAEEWIKPMDAEILERIKIIFHPLPVRFIGLVRSGESAVSYFADYESDVADAVMHTGSTAEEIAEQLGMRLFDVLRALKSLQKKGKVKIFYDGDNQKFTRI